MRDVILRVWFAFTMLPGCLPGHLGTPEQHTFSLDDADTAVEEVEPEKEALHEPPTPEDLAAAPTAEVEPGTVFTATATNERAYVSGMSWTPLSPGQSHWVSFTILSGENADVRVFPVSGDPDIYLYKGTTLVASSIRGTNFADVVTTALASTAPGTYSARFYCYSGTCAFTSTISVGDNTSFELGASPTGYLNQRSWTGTSLSSSVTCRDGSGNELSDGSCMCSDASAAMAVVDSGHSTMTSGRAVAEDLFRYTNRPSDGAGQREPLRKRLDSNYGYAACWEDTDLSTIPSYIRSGYLVLFRSSAFNTYGHYVRLRGYANGGRDLLVDDPIGAWVSRNSWIPLNTTSRGSAHGRGRWYSRSSLSSGASVIVCR